MISVIIAGGSGTRLWPLSTGDYPKHLLKLTNEKSLVQNTYERAKLLGPEVYIISEQSHVEHIKKQLPQLDESHIIVEPARRGTASCVLAVLCKIKAAHDGSEPIVFMHADHHIRDSEGFEETIQRAAKAATQYQKLVLLGLEPTHPAIGFGYIKRGKHVDGDNIFTVDSFKEKPDKKTAQKYLWSGRYLWNMGYFVASLAIFEKELKTFAPALWEQYNELGQQDTKASFNKVYLSLPSAPIDTALIEHIRDLLVIPGDFDWMDVGSYIDVHLVNTQDDDGNSLIGHSLVEDVSNSYVRNDTNTPLAVIGLDNVAVVATKDGILVTNKSYAQKVGEIPKRLKN